MPQHNITHLIFDICWYLTSSKAKAKRLAFFATAFFLPCLFPSCCLLIPPRHAIINCVVINYYHIKKVSIQHSAFGINGVVGLFVFTTKGTTNKGGGRPPSLVVLTTRPPRPGHDGETKPWCMVWWMKPNPRSLHISAWEENERERAYQMPNT